MFLLLAILIVGCGGPNAPLDPRTPSKQEKSGEEPLPQLTYNEHIKPIFVKHCSMCHMAGGGLPSWEDYATVLAKKDVLMARVVTTRTMPPPTMATITDEERQLIADWIISGAPQETPEF